MSKVDIAFGFSPKAVAEEAVREASVQLRSRLTIPKIELCLVFFSLPKEEVKKLSYNIKRILNPRTIVGCSLTSLIAQGTLHKRGVIIIGFSGVEAVTGVISPEQKLFEGPAKFAVVPAYDGEIGILHDHAPLMALLGEGALRVETGSGSLRFRVKGGFVQVVDNEVSVLSEEAFEA